MIYTRRIRKSKKQVVKELKGFLDEHRARISKYGFQLIDSKGDNYKRNPLFMDGDGVTYSKPYACRLYVDIKYTKKMWENKK